MLPTIKFVCLEPGSIFIFREVPDIKTYDQFNHKWIAAPKSGYRNIVLMMLDSPYEAYTKPIEEIGKAVIEELNRTFRKIFNSVEGGYLTIGYYYDAGFIESQVGYLHSTSPTVLAHSFREKNAPPHWFNLKAFC